MIPIVALTECRRRHESARPKRGLLGMGGTKVRLDHGTWADTHGEEHDRLFADGRVVWGALVMANSGLFAPGKRDLPAAVVYSHDDTFDSNPLELKQVATKTVRLKDTLPDDPQLRAFAAEVTDETARENNTLVPPALTYGKVVRYETLYIQRHRLPTQYLADWILPVIVNPKRPTHVMVLPLEYWSPQLVQHWRTQAKRNPPREVPEPQATPDDLAAFAQNPVTLTPGALAEVQMIIQREQFGPEVKLRVGYEQGGYELDLTEEGVDPEKDLLYDFRGIAVVVHQDAAAKLANVEIDVGIAGKGKGFVFKKRRP